MLKFWGQREFIQPVKDGKAYKMNGLNGLRDTRQEIQGDQEKRTFSRGKSSPRAQINLLKQRMSC